MAKQFFENTTKAPKSFYGVTLQPGEQKWIEVPGPSVAPPATYPLGQDPITKRIYGADGQDLSSLAAGVGITRAVRGTVAFAVVGQSNQRGQAFDSSGTVPVRFAGGGLVDPIAPAVAQRGSAWPRFAELIQTRGYQISGFFNCALGSISMVREVCGQSVSRGSAGQGANSPAFRRARASSGGGDMGDYGSVTRQGGRVFRCSAGARQRWVYYSSAVPLVINGTNYTGLDYLVEETAGGNSGGVDPNWAGATVVGNTVVDGGITWELMSLSDAGMPTNTGILGPGNLGFDPLGILKRACDALDGVVADQKILLFANAEADVWTNRNADATYKGWYKSALTNALAYARGRGVKVGLGLSSMAQGTDAEVMALMQQAKDEVLAASAGDAGVIRGADLWQLWGAGSAQYQYPEGGNGQRVHLTDKGQLIHAQAWMDALAPWFPAVPA